MDTNSKSNISLEKAIEILESRAEYERLNKNYEARHDYMQLVEWLKELKKYDKMAIKALQEPKTGHWIRTYGNVKCSVCGSVKDSRDVGKATHYCDFCGAKMIEKENCE